MDEQLITIAIIRKSNMFIFDPHPPNYPYAKLSIPVN